MYVFVVCFLHGVQPRWELTWDYESYISCFIKGQLSDLYSWRSVNLSWLVIVSLWEKLSSCLLLKGIQHTWSVRQKQVVGCVMGNVGSSVSGAWTVLRTTNQDISASAAQIFNVSVSPVRPSILWRMMRKFATSWVWWRTPAKILVSFSCSLRWWLSWCSLIHWM